MPWTVDNPPSVAKNWTQEEKKKCVAAANAVLDETGDEGEAIQACIHAAGKGQNSPDALAHECFGGFMLRREIQFERVKRDEESGDLIIDVAFSSETPVERWWGTEILDHSRKSVRLERLNDHANVFFNHDPDAVIGVHVKDSVKIGKDRILRGKVRLTRATTVGREAIAMVEDRVLTKSSIGYMVHKVIEESEDRDGEVTSRQIDGYVFETAMKRNLARSIEHFYKDLDFMTGDGEERHRGGPRVFRVTDWEPFENSLVTVPADTTVGVGRSNQPAGGNQFTPSEEGRTMGKTKDGAVLDPATDTPPGDHDDKKGQQQQQQDDAKAVAQVRAADKPNPVDLEKARKAAITKLCTMNKLDDRYRDMWIGQGLSVEDVADEMLLILEERGKSNPQPLTKLGLTEPERRTFSMRRAIIACTDQKWEQAGFELECSREIAKRLQRPHEPYKFYVPFEVLERPIDRQARQQRDLTVGTAGAGGFLVQTDNVGFIEILRNRSVAFRMGVRRLSGLVGSVTIPRQSAAATAVWLANEASSITESQQTFQQVALSPKNVGAYTEISRQLLLQSAPGAEGIVSDDLAQVVAIAADLAVLNGSGASGQPLGIIGTSGIGSVTGTTLGLAGILDFQADVAAANVMPVRGGYVTTAAVAALLRARTEFANTATPIWNGNLWDATVVGFPAMSSEQMPAAEMLFGDWQEAVVGEWGVLEVEVNPYANFQAGIIGVRAIYSLDVGVRRPAAFSHASSIT